MTAAELVCHMPAEPDLSAARTMRADRRAILLPFPVQRATGIASIVLTYRLDQTYIALI
jgi:hypothetical protein